MGPGILRVLKLKVIVACRDLRVARYSQELRTADRELRVHIDIDRERVATSNSKTRILSTPVCVTYIDRGILIRYPLGRTENILERFHDEVRFY